MVFKVLIVENNPEENFYNEVLGKYGINVLTSATPEDVFKQLDSTVSLVIFEHDGKKRNGLS
tara:strand:- start:323 stop:508 length:186 start_codon:yes stop_codon:yes gene_type:complete